MAFWSKKTGPANPEDDGTKINQRAALLQKIAREGSTGAETLSALANALGNEAAAIIVQHPNVQNSGTQHLTKSLDGMLDLIKEQVREFAYIKATGSSPSSDLPPPPQNDEGKDLTEEEFKALTTRIINTATKNNTPVNDAITATIKAVGVMISILAERPGDAAEELIEFSKKAVAEFARDAIAYQASQKNR